MYVRFNQNECFKKPFDEIHRVILEAGSKKHAEFSLGIFGNYKLQRYLGAFLYKEMPLSYARLKEIKPEEMQAHYGEDYNKIWKHNAVSLLDLSPEMVFRVIALSNSKADALASLGHYHDVKSLDLFLTRYKCTYREITNNADRIDEYISEKKLIIDTDFTEENDPGVIFYNELNESIKLSNQALVGDNDTYHEMSEEDEYQKSSFPFWNNFRNKSQNPPATEELVEIENGVAPFLNDW